MKEFLIIILSFNLLACFPGLHQIDLQQGNIVEQTQIDKLQIGMSKSKVKQLLGTPMIVDNFNENNWQYVYTYRNQNKETFRSHLTVVFNNENVVEEIKK